MIHNARLLAAVAEVERAHDPDHRNPVPEPRPLRGSTRERVERAVREAEDRLAIAANGPALPTPEEVQADRQREEHERWIADNPEAAREDPNLTDYYTKLERDRWRERQTFRDDVIERQP